MRALLGQLRARDASRGYRWHFRLARVFIAVAATGLVAGFTLLPSSPETKPKPSRAAAVSPAEVREAALVVLHFVRTAVVRQRVAYSYDLVTPELRQGLSRAEWATGNIPVAPYLSKDWRTVRFWLRPESVRRSEIRFTVLLVSADGDRQFYAVALRPYPDRWRVSYWAPIREPALFARPVTRDRS